MIQLHVKGDARVPVQDPGDAVQSNFGAYEIGPIVKQPRRDLAPQPVSSNPQGGPLALATVIMIASEDDGTVTVDQFKPDHQGAVQKVEVKFHLNGDGLAAVERISGFAGGIHGPQGPEPELVVSGRLTIGPRAHRLQFIAPFGKILVDDPLCLAVAYNSSPVKVYNA